MRDAEDEATETTRVGLARSVGRAVALRCPRCGGSGMVRRWPAVRAACPACGLRTDRGESDHFLGAMALNLVVAELLTAGAVLGVLLSSWPDPPWRLVTWGGVALAALLPVAFYPVSKLVWLALDLRLRPEGRGGGGTSA